MQIIQCTWKKIKRIKITPEDRSIQLAKFFQSPIEDLTSKMPPIAINNTNGIFIPAPNIKISPAIKSIAPNILISIFFKSKNCLKIYQAWVAQPGLEHVPPKDGVAGSNPVPGILAK